MWWSDLGHETVQIKGVNYVWEDIFFLMLPSCQMSRAVHPPPHTLKERGWITRSKILSTWGLALIPKVCIWQDESSVQPGCPAKAFIPLHTVHHMDWLLLKGMYLCIPASPQPSPQCGMCRQRHRQTALHTGSCSSCCSSFTHLLLDKPTGWRAELLIPVIHFFWHKHPSQLNHRWEDTSYMHAKEWEGKRKEADFMVLFVYTGIIL